MKSLALVLPLTALLSAVTGSAAAQTPDDSERQQIIDTIFGPGQGDAADPAPTPDPPGGSGADNGLSRTYPVELNLQQLSRAGATPGAAYVILRDLKSTLTVSSAGGRITLNTPGRTLNYRKGTRAATINGQPATLNATPVGTSEDSLFPLAALKLLGCSYQPLESQRQVRTYALSCPGANGALAVQALTLKNTNPAPGALRPATVPRLGHSGQPAN